MKELEEEMAEKKEKKVYESVEERMREENISRGIIATESIRTTYRKKIWSKFIKAVKDFDLVQDGDKIAVGISGGKDSLLLAKVFQELAKDRTKKFELAFISMNPGFESMDVDQFKRNLEELDIPCEIFDANVWEVAFKEDPEKPCFLCAKMRRGVLYNKVEELGYNKLALGHHFDDLVETALINQFYAGTVKTMIPKVKSTTGKLELIRPLIYVKEEDIINYTKRNGIEAMACGCPIESGKVDSKRKEIKKLLADLSEINPNIKQSIFNSMKNINLDYVLGYTRGNKKDVD